MHRKLQIDALHLRKDCDYGRRSHAKILCFDSGCKLGGYSSLAPAAVVAGGR